MKHDTVLVLDFGSPDAQKIAKNLRLKHFYTEVLPYTAKDVESRKPKALILSDGSRSDLLPDLSIWDLGVPILAIGKTAESICKQLQIPLNYSEGELTSAHPEHTLFCLHELDFDLIQDFIHRCKLQPTWTPEAFIHESIAQIQKQVKSDTVILGLSGGVDSSVVAALLHKAIGDKLVPIFVDNGCMRYEEAKRVKEYFACMPELDIRFVDASELFYSKLKGVEDPEKKRKIIGGTFIDVFEAEAAKYQDARWLAQGTIYSDVIESIGADGKSTQVKSHHNVGGLPETMKLSLVEPIRSLFKDEVRRVGLSLGLPSELIDRHPFPGPGLAVRILGEVNPQRVHTLQLVDEIFIRELRAWGLYHSTWQAFAVLLPLRSTGVRDGKRTYESVCALRAVNSEDAMSASVTRLPYEFLEHVSSLIIKEVRQINRVVFDISSKPPATIEWE